jgi:hypothetical protein
MGDQYTGVAVFGPKDGEFITSSIKRVVFADFKPGEMIPVSRQDAPSVSTVTAESIEMVVYHYQGPTFGGLGIWVPEDTDAEEALQHIVNFYGVMNAKKKELK